MLLIVQQVVNIIHQVKPRLVVHYLRIRYFQVRFSKPFHLCTEKFFFVQVLTTFLIIIFPLHRELFFNIYRQQA